jgi:hypothetical protein
MTDFPPNRDVRRLDRETGGRNDQQTRNHFLDWRSVAARRKLNDYPGTEGSEISEHITRRARTKEGDQLRRFYELKLDRRDPMFVLSWMLFHVIDKDSPLHGLTASDLTEGDALLVLNVGGVDDSSAQQLYARQGHHQRFTAGSVLARLHQIP